MMAGWLFLSCAGAAGFVHGPLPEVTPFAGNTSIVLDGTVEDLPGATFQWFADGSPLDGETNPTLSLTDLQPSDAGTYGVQVSYGGSVVIETGTRLEAAGAGAGFGPIYGIGHLPGGDMDSVARDAIMVEGVLHAVGSGIIGAGYGFGAGASASTYWRSDEGLYAIPNLEPDSPGQAFISANGITPDGQYIATRSRSDLSNTRLPVRVSTGDFSILTLPTPLDFVVSSAATAISDDGDTLAGFYFASPAGFRGFVHDITDDTLTVLSPILADSDNVFIFNARSISSDGSVVVGHEIDVEAAGDGRRAFRFESGGGSELIPLPSGGTWSAAVATSMDGGTTLVIGDATDYSNGELYLHDANDDSLTSLGTPWPEGTPGDSFGLTGDVSVAVGAFMGGGDDPERRSYIRNEHGWFSLEDAVAGLGASLDGWELDTAFGISRDGRLIYGGGERGGLAEGFVIEFPEGYLANFDPASSLPIFGMGDLIGGDTQSAVRDAVLVEGEIHAVGFSVIGAESGFDDGGSAAAYWSSFDGLKAIPNAASDAAGNSIVLALGITPDAEYIASRTRADSGNRRRAVRVASQDLSLDLLPLAPDEAFASAANSISATGNILGGFYADSGGAVHAYVVNVDTGLVTPIDSPQPDDDFTLVAPGRGLSADGSIVVGTATDTDVAHGDRAFRYSAGDGYEVFPLLSGGQWNRALGVSPDGLMTLLAGDSTDFANGELYVHVETDGSVHRLGSPAPDRAPAGIIHMSDDGSVLAAAFIDSSTQEQVSFVHNEHGWFPLEEVVEAAGGDLTDWDLDRVVGVSRDARLVYGSGDHGGAEEGFVITFPEDFLAGYERESLGGPENPEIVGGWRNVDGDETVIFVATADGYYAHMENVVGDEEPGDVTGYEIGEYAFGLDGSFRVRTNSDANGGIGFSGHNGRDDLTIAIVDDALSLTVPGEGVFVFERIWDDSIPLVGAWILRNDGPDADEDEVGVIVFAADGLYYYLEEGETEESAQSGIEWGSYAWNSETGGFTASNIGIDQNGEWGLSHPEGPVTVELGNFDFTFEYIIGEESGTFDRVAILPVDITTQPMGDELDAGETLSLSVEVAGEGPFTYQWRHNGEDIEGEIGSSLNISGITVEGAGTYDVVITGPDGSVVSASAFVSVEEEEPSDASLRNLSVRHTLATGDVFALPFRIEGSASKQVLLRAVGPTLALFGLPNAMADPRIRLVDSLGFEVAVNDDWEESDGATVASVSSSVGAFGLASESEDAGLVVQVSPGSYTLLIDSAGGGGVVLGEIYDADLGAVPSDSRLVYLAALGDTSVGNLVTGFVASGTDPADLLVRAVGPGTGLVGASGNPSLTLVDISQQTVVQNDDWDSLSGLDVDFEDVGAPALMAGSTDAAVLVEPSSGAYTIHSDGSPGRVLVEIYDFYNRTLSTTPILLIPPRSMSANEGEEARFEVYPAGAGPISFQWLYEGSPISGATSPHLDFTAVAPEDAGEYVLRLTNGAGSFDSAPVSLVVVPSAAAPSITSHPADVTVQSGTSATLNVAVDSTADGLAYQWYEGQSGDTSLPISGATSASYMTPALSTTTSYWVRATDDAGMVDSNVATVTVAEPSDIFATHNVVGRGYRAGGTVTIATTFNYSGPATALGLEVDLPAGWSYASSTGEDVPGTTPGADTTGTIGWAYTNVPTSPVSFSYTLNVPEGETAPIVLTAIYRFRDGSPSGEQVITVTPAPLTVPSTPPFHTADTDGDSRFSLSELLRVIELYNTRNGTTRTGHYRVQSDTEDGFAPEPTLTDGESGGLVQFHAGDTNRDGKFSLSELLRIIELYNYRSGTTRTGEYRSSPGSEDGFAPGPEPEF